MSHASVEIKVRGAQDRTAMMRRHVPTSEATFVERSNLDQQFLNSSVSSDENYLL